MEIEECDLQFQNLLKILTMEDRYKELRDKIAKGVEQAAVDLIKERQKKNSYLVVTDDDGNVIRKPAREFKI